MAMLATVTRGMALLLRALQPALGAGMEDYLGKVRAECERRMPNGPEAWMTVVGSTRV